MSALLFERIFSWFERRIDPLVPLPERPVPRGALAYLWFFVSQARWAFAAMLVLGGVTAVIEASLYVFVGDLVDRMQAGGRDSFMRDNGLALALMALTILILRPLAASLTALVEEQIVVPGFFNLVRFQGHSQVTAKSLAFFQDEFAGRISQKVWQSGQSAGDFMVSLLEIIWFIVVFALFTLSLATSLDGAVGVAVLVWLVLFAAAARVFVPRIRKGAKASAHAASGVTGRLVDSYGNIQTLKLFSDAAQEDAGTRAAYRDFLASVRRFTRTLTGMRIAVNLLSGVMLTVIATLIVSAWQAGTVTTGGVALVLALVLRLQVLLGRLMGQLNGLFRALGSLHDSAETITRPVTVTDRPGAPALAVDRAGIDFQNIRFHYGKDGGVIEDLSLKIAPGEKVGLVGRSGAGKSTMINLLLRFYDLEGGRILIDGQDISAVTQASLRERVGVVTQDTALLHRSIRENIALGRAGAREDEIREAARRAHAETFIAELSDNRGRSGFDAHVGERGVKLSGGQRQRIAIARVLLKNAPILVLDEATSALDSEIEAAIQESLSELMRDKTVIAIAHRLSTIAAMDRLIVMDRGRIVEDGPHEALLERGGLYADLWNRQSGGFLAPERVA
ncbi:ABC transporter ATP-binding protein/permease [Stappia stellulata]|nr:ABC transporter ATP-binding protein [Stappia stellulata]MCA1242316.1 ABC transporter ATP-binding protein/permease [Stappia stellulata]